MSASTDRDYDIVLFGATGFTGALTAEYLARHAPADLRWALAGRNRAKLTTLRARLASENPACADLPMLHADVNDPASLREIVTATRVTVTTVGPYIQYGEPLVAACAEAGTDYLDLTGEPEFIDLTYVRHHARAVATGARIVHCCGFDAIPSDLGAYYTVAQLPEDVPIRLRGFVRAKGIPSGGTLHSTVLALSRNRETAKASAARRQVEPRDTERRVSGIKSMPRYEPAVGAWALPLPTIDPQIVLRSARALERYGPDFSYGHYARVKRLPVALGIAGGVAAAVGLAQLPATRAWLLARKRPGDGPTPEQREKGWFTTRFIGEGGGRRVVTEVAGGDPGYGETSKMLAESALCMARDDLPSTAGQVTTAVAMGEALIERLTRAGITFTVLESS